VSYSHNATHLTGGYQGGVYDPIGHRIFFVPYVASNFSHWHYFDCHSSSVQSYAHGLTLNHGAYVGGVSDPIQNKIIFIPWSAHAGSHWHGIQILPTQAVIPQKLLAHSMFNKY
jgi:hypothetical protein